MSSIMTSIQQYLPAAGIILLPHLGGVVSGWTMNKDLKGWYTTLKRPAFNPPNWIFGPVWFSLYTCMGISSYMIFKEGGFEEQAFPLTLYGTHLLLNWAWSPIFFRFHRIDLALVEILALWSSIAAMIGAFYPVNHTAALLLLPYLGWASFATFLNFTYWRLNGRGDNLKAIKEKE